MVSSGNGNSAGNAALEAAVEADDSETLLNLIASREFTLLEIEGESDEDEEKEVVTAECDDVPMLVAFSNDETAGQFVQAMGDEFDSDEIPAIVVEGKALLEFLPEGFGILLDPESDQCCVISPELIGANGRQ